MAPLGRRFYRKSRFRTGKHNPWVVVAIVTGSVLLLTLLAGNLLNLFLDDEAYQRWTEGDDTTPPVSDTPVLPNRPLPIKAYPYDLENGGSFTAESRTAAVFLNGEDGRLSCSSEVSELFALESGSSSLTSRMSYLSGRADYISGVYHVTAFNEQADATVYYAAAARDGAILREFVQAGGREVVLSGFPLAEMSYSDLMAYLAQIKEALPLTPVGVSIGINELLQPRGWELLSQALMACDFCVIDLRGEATDTEGAPMTPERVLNATDYYRSQYGARLMVGAGQSGLLAGLDQKKITDYMIVEGTVTETTPTPDPEPDTGETPVG